MATPKRSRDGKGAKRADGAPPGAAPLRDAEGRSAAPGAGGGADGHSDVADLGALPAPRRRRMRRSDWLDLGLRQLAARGPDRMGIDALCVAAGKTRGSFYHHFDDHDAFIDAMLGRWADRQTFSVIAEVEAAPPERRPGMLVLASLRLDPRLDGALRAFGRTHKGAAARIAEVDAARLGYLERLHRDLNGLKKGAASALARLEYAAFIGGLMIWPEADPVDHRVAASRFQMLVRLAVAADLAFDAEDRRHEPAPPPPPNPFDAF